MKTKTKYHNIKTKLDGIVFDSRKEARRFPELKLMEKAGLISNLQRQVRIELIPAQKDENGKVIERRVDYIADFVYQQNGQTVYEDTKGKRTPDYIIKRKLMLWVKGIRIKEV